MPDRLNTRRLWVPVLAVLAAVAIVDAFRADPRPELGTVVASLAR